MLKCWTIAAMLGLTITAGWAATERRQRGGPDLEAGMTAPDFELPRLKIAANGKATIGPEMVRLSSFRGKRPVVVVLSSYT